MMSLVQKLTYILGLIAILTSCEGITERKIGYEVHGIDVSRYQLDVDWPKVKSQNIHFVFVKATEGRAHIDDYFCKNWKTLAEQDIKKGAYHFFRPSVDPQEQFINFRDMVELQNGDLAPVVDFEVVGDYSVRSIEDKLMRLIDLFEKHYQVKPIIYTNLKLYNKYIGSQFDKYPVWIARYNHKTPMLNFGSSWAFWQYGNRGQLDGIKGNVDLNVFHGSLLDLESLCYFEE